MAIKHPTVKAPGQTLAAVADWNANHTIDINTIKDTHIDWGLGANQVSTTDMTEGINLYFTDERVDDRVAALIQNGIGITWTYNDVANTLTANCDLTWAELNKTVSDIADITTKSHTSLTDIGTNTHAQIDTKITEYNAHDHSAADPTQVDHANLTNVTSDQHHAQSHNAASHSDIASTGAQIDDAVSKKHDRQHAITDALDHTSTATPAQILKADANGLPIDATNTDAQVSGAVTASHAKQHAIDSAADHTSTITQNNLMDADASGLPDDSGLTVANTSDAITKKHTQNTDTALGAGAEAADHGAAATDQIINVSYGVGAPPAANTTTEGSLFVKYTA